MNEMEETNSPPPTLSDLENDIDNTSESENENGYEQELESEKNQVPSLSPQSNESSIKLEKKTWSPLSSTDLLNSASITTPANPNQVSPSIPSLSQEPISLNPDMKQIRQTNEEDPMLELPVLMKLFPSLPSSIVSLEENLNRSPFSSDLWLELLNKAESTHMSSDYLRNVHERCLQFFPTSVRIWMDYLNLECKYAGLSLFTPMTASSTTSVNTSLFSNIEKLFGRCLKVVHHPDLWRLYIAYLKKKSLILNNNQLDRNLLIKAYEYALTFIGNDPNSGNIWADYIDFIKQNKTEGTYEEQVKMDMCRKIFQRAIIIPLNNIEILWRDYDSFEHSLNKMTAKKIIAEKSAAYMNARSAYKEWKRIAEPINRYIIISMTPQSADLKQIAAWWKLIEWEKSNPLHLEKQAVYQRALITYKMALSHVRFQAELWFDMFLYTNKESSLMVAIDHLKQAVTALPFNLLLTSALSEAHEELKEYSSSKQVYENLLERQLKQIERLVRLKESTEKQSEASFSTMSEEEKQQSKIKRSEGIKRIDNELSSLQRDHCLVYIQAIRFSRRTEEMNSARQYFSRARKLSFCHYEVYVVAALMEYFIAKEHAIAFKIFELGMKKFSGEISFVKEYMKLLLTNMDDANARALFERTLQTVSNIQETLPLFDMLIEYERDFGFFPSLRQLSDRKLNSFSNETEWSLLIQRSRFLDLKPVTDESKGSYLVKSESDLGKEEESKPKKLVKKHKKITDTVGRVHWEGESQLTQAVNSGHESEEKEAEHENKLNLDDGREFDAEEMRFISPPLRNFIHGLGRPKQYKGPHLNVEEIIQLMNRITLPSSIPSSYFHSRSPLLGGPDLSGILTSSSSLQPPYLGGNFPTPSMAHYRPHPPPLSSYPPPSASYPSTSTQGPSTTREESFHGSPVKRAKKRSTTSTSKFR